MLLTPYLTPFSSLDPGLTLAATEREAFDPGKARQDAFDLLVLVGACMEVPCILGFYGRVVDKKGLDGIREKLG